MFFAVLCDASLFFTIFVCKSNETHVKDYIMHTMKVPVSYSDDISELLSLALETLGYENERIIHYSFLIEEALLKWKDSGLSERELLFSRADTRKNVEFVWEVVGEASNPFEIDPATSETDCVSRMKDLLLSGVGSEIRYSYKKGINIITLNLPKRNHTENLFQRNLTQMAIPLSFQALMACIATYVDSFMVGFLDVNAMSAVSQLSQFINTHIFLVIACETASTVVITQLWGKRDRTQMQHAKGIAIQLSLFISFVFWAGAFLFPKQIMSFYTDIPELMPYGVAYLKAISFSFLITAAYRMCYCYMRIVGKTKTCMLYSIYACILNVICNAVFIFGLFGIPKMGAYGAALSTTLSASLQLALVIVSAVKDRSQHVSWTYVRYNSPMARNFFATFFPIAAQFATWLLASNILASAFGHMNADILAANSILVIITSLIMCAATGVSSSCAIMIGSLLGKNHPDTTWRSAQIMMKIATRMAFLAVSLIVVLGLASLLLPLNMTAAAIRYTYILIAIYSVNVFFGFQNNIINNGALYAGGEAKSILFIDSIVMWGVMVPVALASIYWVEIPVALLFFILKFDETLSFPYKYYRYRCKAWLRNR